MRSGDAYVHDECVVLTPCDNSKRGAVVYSTYFSNEGEIKVRFDYLMQVIIPLFAGPNPRAAESRSRIRLP